MATITPLPTPVPSRQDPSNFAARADAFLTALPTFGTEANAVAAEVITNKNTAVSSANTATTQAGIATAAASTATTQAGIATTKAGEAQALTAAYQGALPSNPTTNKTGGDLSNGDWYVNTTTSSIRVYSSGVWVTSVSAAGVSSVNGQTGDIDNIREINEVTNTVSAPTTMVSGGFYIATSATTLTLPLSPLNGDWVVVINRSSANLTVARNGNNIMGLAENMTIDKQNVPVKLLYVSTAGGWIFA